MKHARILTMIMALLLSCAAHAVDYVYTNINVAGAWSWPTAGNWDPNGVPNGTADTISLSPGLPVGQKQFDLQTGTKTIKAMNVIGLTNQVYLGASWGGSCILRFEADSGNASLTLDAPGVCYGTPLSLPSSPSLDIASDLDINSNSNTTCYAKLLGTKTINLYGNKGELQLWGAGGSGGACSNFAGTIVVHQGRLACRTAGNYTIPIRLNGGVFYKYGYTATYTNQSPLTITANSTMGVGVGNSSLPDGLVQFGALQGTGLVTKTESGRWQVRGPIKPGFSTGTLAINEAGGTLFITNATLEIDQESAASDMLILSNMDAVVDLALIDLVVTGSSGGATQTVFQVHRSSGTRIVNSFNSLTLPDGISLVSSNYDITAGNFSLSTIPEPAALTLLIAMAFARRLR